MAGSWPIGLALEHCLAAGDAGPAAGRSRVAVARGVPVPGYRRACRNREPGREYDRRARRERAADPGRRCRVQRVATPRHGRGACAFRASRARRRDGVDARDGGCGWSCNAGRFARYRCGVAAGRAVPAGARCAGGATARARGRGRTCACRTVAVEAGRYAPAGHGATARDRHHCRGTRSAWRWLYTRATGAGRSRGAGRDGAGSARQPV